MLKRWSWLNENQNEDNLSLPERVAIETLKKKAARKRWYDNRSEKERTYSKDYYEKHKEAIKLKRRIYYLQNRDKILQRVAMLTKIKKRDNENEPDEIL
jgi:hypothetical protein